MLTILRIIKPPTKSIPQAVQSNLLPISRFHKILIISGFTMYKAPQGNREKRQNPACHASLRGMHGHLPLQPEALADDVACLVQNLGKIASALLLDHNRGSTQCEDPEGDAVNQVVHGGSHLETVILFLKAGFEFTADGVGALPRHGPIAAIRL